MKVGVDKRVEKFLQDLSIIEKARISRVANLFSDKGFQLTELYLKKITRSIWELRAGKVRLLFGVIQGQAIIVHAFLKKTDKTPLKEIKTAEGRLRIYEEQK